MIRIRVRQVGHAICSGVLEATPMPESSSLLRVSVTPTDIDAERCACGGALKIIAAIEEPAVIARVLTHLNLPARAPARSPARSASLIHAA